MNSWCREGGEPPRPCDRRILSPIFALSQKAAGERTDPNNLHRMKEKSAGSMLQDVAVNASNVGDEHAPEHGPNFGLPER
jgi:hypothetical protein